MRIYQNDPASPELVDRLRKIPFLNAFDDQHLKNILTVSRILAYDANEIIIPEGTVGGEFYVLLGGKVKVVKNQNQIATLCRAGDLFGELSALSNDIRTASVIAVDTTWCLELKPHPLEILPTTEQNACYILLYRFIAQVVAARLKKTTDELVLVTGELEVTRHKLSELQQQSSQQVFSDELALAVEQLRRTKERLSRLGRTTAEAPPP
ncbi:MAG: cyclic nucleotide-binding domain-containing protein [Candidatus Competibacteraceae bacterium]|nr:cyclic nucleotide-binding domain-containing protein [Candidatus Competibacteraceae bacterium]